MKWHHRPANSKRCQVLTDVVHVADGLCLNMGWGIGADDGMNYRLDEEATRRLGLSLTDGETIVARVMLEMKDMLDQFPALQEA